jgi:hypothetical protein
MNEIANSGDNEEFARATCDSSKAARNQATGICERIEIGVLLVRPEKLTRPKVEAGCKAMCAVRARERHGILLKPVININSAEQAFLAPRLLLNGGITRKSLPWFVPFTLLLGKFCRGSK